MSDSLVKCEACAALIDADAQVCEFCNATQSYVPQSVTWDSVQKSMDALNESIDRSNAERDRLLATLSERDATITAQSAEIARLRERVVEWREGDKPENAGDYYVAKGEEEVISLLYNGDDWYWPDSSDDYLPGIHGKIVAYTPMPERPAFPTEFTKQETA